MPALSPASCRSAEVRKGARCDARVAGWYAGTQDAGLYLSVLVTSEIRTGIESARPRDPRKAEVLESWLQEVERAFAERILPIDARVADRWGRMDALRPIPVFNGLLAATAKAHGMTLVTRNASNVEGLGANVLNPFEA